MRLDKKTILINWVANQLIKQGQNLEDYKYPEVNIFKVKPTAPIRSIEQYPQVSVGITHNPIVLFKREGGHFCFKEYMVNATGYSVSYTLMNQIDIYLHKKTKEWK